jgi:hypothetical protein
VNYTPALECRGFSTLLYTLGCFEMRVYQKFKDRDGVAGGRFYLLDAMYVNGTKSVLYSCVKIKSLPFEVIWDVCPTTAHRARRPL